MGRGERGRKKGKGKAYFGFLNTAAKEKGKGREKETPNEREEAGEKGWCFCKIYGAVEGTAAKGDTEKEKGEGIAKKRKEDRAVESAPSLFSISRQPQRGEKKKD